MGIQEKELKQSAATTVALSSTASSISSNCKNTDMITIDGLPKGLTIKTSKTTTTSRSTSTTTSTPTTTTAPESEPNYIYSSPSLISPPSSAFASALQSPYISPRTPPLPLPLPCSNSHSDAAVHSSNSSTSCTPPPDDNRSDEFSDACASTDQDNNHSHYLLNHPGADHRQQQHLNKKPQPPPFHSTAATEPPPGAPRLSFSFPVIPRVSFARGSSSVISSTAAPTIFNINNTRLRSCDVFIGYHHHHHHHYTDSNSNLVRFSKWLKSELEMQGIACFLADRGRYADSQSHEIADRVICSVSYGIVIVSSTSLISNRFCVEELRFFSQKNNLIPILFDSAVEDIIGGVLDDDDDVERREAIDGLIRAHGKCKLEASRGDWRNCVFKAASLLTSKLGRKSSTVTEKDRRLSFQIQLRGSGGDVEEDEELPFLRNKRFVGREKEITEIELSFFGGRQCFSSSSQQQRYQNQNQRGVVIRGNGSAKSSSASERYEDDDDEETTNEIVASREQQQHRYISLEMAGGNCCSTTGSSENSGTLIAARNSYKRLPPKYKKKSRTDNNQLVCITGPAGIGKTELALEFAYRHRHKYKQVLWIGGESRYMRQNILSLAHERLNLDMSADPEKNRGRIRSFEEQEIEAFKRVRREIFKEMPYLVVIDNLESEEKWWEGKDLGQLIPRNMGGSHVVITTRLEKVKMSSLMMQLQPIPVFEMVMAMGLGQKKKGQIEEEEMEYVKKFNERLMGSSAFGLTVVGCLMSELRIAPSALYEALEHHREEVEGGLTLEKANYDEGDDDTVIISPFLKKLLGFCFSVLEKENKRSSYNYCMIASRMLLVSSCLAPAPVSASILATAAKNMISSSSRVSKWKTNCLNHAFCCSGGGGGGGCGGLIHQTQVNSSAMMLVRFGLARRTARRRGGLLWIQFHPIVTQFFGRIRKRVTAGSVVVQVAAVAAVRKIGDPVANSDHLWASAYLMFGFESNPPLVQRLKAIETVSFIKKTAIPLAVWAYTTFSRCKSGLELLEVCTGALEEVEKSFVARVEEWPPGQWGWSGWGRKKRGSSSRRMKSSAGPTVSLSNKEKVDEYVWQEVTLLKATLLETRAKLLVRGGCFDSAEELCRTCISIRTVMLGHTHVHTLAAQQTLAKLVRLRTRI